MYKKSLNLDAALRSLKKFLVLIPGVSLVVLGCAVLVAEELVRPILSIFLVSSGFLVVAATVALLRVVRDVSLSIDMWDGASASALYKEGLLQKLRIILSSPTSLATPGVGSDAMTGPEFTLDVADSPKKDWYH